MLRRVERLDAAAAPADAAGRPPPKRGTKNVPSDAQHSEPPGRSDEPRASFLRRWPAALWLLVYVGSIFILNGSRRLGPAPARARHRASGDRVRPGDVP